MPQESSINNGETLRTVIQAVGYLVTWLIVFLGWRVAANQNKIRDERKEIRDKVDELCEAIDDAKADFVSHLTSESIDLSLYWKVFLSAGRINNLIRQFPLGASENVNNRLIEFRKILTGDALGGPSSKRLPKMQHHVFVRDIARTANSLNEAI
ncbi:hypothetical protein [Cupriavidus oxalaticus]|uniref:hypothetical protein n=1 Tax=Cupriavidus oxalaticus TaxID=96344 RepID=UPI0040333F28